MAAGSHLEGQSRNLHRLTVRLLGLFVECLYFLRTIM